MINDSKTHILSSKKYCVVLKIDNGSRSVVHIIRCSGGTISGIKKKASYDLKALFFYLANLKHNL